MEDFLKLLQSLWPKFWPLIIAPPIYAVLAKNFLAGPRWTGMIRDWLTKKEWHIAYAVLLNKLIAWLDSFFGSRLFGFQAFGRCLQLALFYSMLWLVVISLISNLLIDRTIEFLVILTLSAFVIIATFYISKILSDFFYAQRCQNNILAAGALIVVEHVCYIGFIIIIIALADYVISIYGVGRGIPVILALIIDSPISSSEIVVGFGWICVVAFSIVGIAIGAGASAALLVTITLAIFQGPLPFYIILMSFFFIIVPLVNSIVDYFSWGVSRWLLKYLQKDAVNNSFLRRWVLLGLHILIDIVLAVFAMFCIAVILSIGFTGHLDHAWISARDNPFSLEGSALSLMFISTLIPTVLHLLCAIFSILPSLPIGYSKILNLIPSDENFSQFEAGDRLVVSTWLTAWIVGCIWIGWVIILAVLATLKLIFEGGFWVTFFELAKSAMEFEIHFLPML